MKCPHCGYEDKYITKQFGELFRDAVYKRLTEYGYPDYMTPQKHQAYVATTKVIRLRLGLKGRTGGSMSEDDAKRGIATLDEVLPPIEEISPRED